jgi:hypothetical protein
VSAMVLSGRRQEVVLGSFFTPAASSVYFMAKWWLLPPLASAMVSSGWRLQVIFNLQALMPLRRPFGTSAAGSRLTAPSGSVPGDGEVDCVVQWNCGGEGAGLDCLFSFSSRVTSVKCKGLSVISYFRRTLFVRCTSTAYDQ